MITEKKFYGGAVRKTTGSSALSLTRSSNRLWHVIGSGSGGIKLDDATKFQKGGFWYILNKMTATTCNIYDNDNNLIKALAAGKCWIFCLIDNSTAAGSWIGRQSTINGYA